MSTRPNEPSLLDLPPELRRDIFLRLFRSTTIYSDKYALAILRVCRQIYHEAEPLALPNVRVYCNGNAHLIDTLTRMGPAHITRLRHLVVSHCPVGFKLFPRGERSQPGARDPSLAEDYDSDSDSDGRAATNWRNGIRYFHLGAVLALFPGLQLDLLEVFSGLSGGPYTGFQTTECFGSLLEADGYRRLWMEATPGDGDAWVDTPETMLKWEDAIMAKFKPCTKWMVRIRLDEWHWECLHDSDEDDFWKMARNAGFTLEQCLEDEDDEDTWNKDGHDSEDTADIVVDRGDADFVVKPDDNRVLRCIARSEDDDSPSYFKSASDALKNLFKVYSWETIQAMDGFDNGSIDSWNGGDVVYAMW